MGRLPWLMMILGIIGEQGKLTEAFTAYNCSNRSNVVESYLLLEPDACAVSDKTGEVEMAANGEIVQMKQDRIIPIFRCQVIETIVSQHCGHCSSTTVTCYIRIISFPDGKTMSGEAAHGLYEITLREEFAKINKPTRSITLSSGIQA
jgi:hypothetical protein